MRNVRSRQSSLTRSFARRLRRLMSGVPVAGLVLLLRPTDLTCLRWRVALFEPISDQAQDVDAVSFGGKAHRLRLAFEGSLHMARRMACAHYPSAAIHFGPARGYTRFRIR